MAKMESAVSIAIHEAGHAVCILAVGRALHSVSIEPGNGFEGRTQHQKWNPVLWNDYVDKLCISYSGRFAEAKFSGVNPSMENKATDSHKILRMLDEFNHHDKKQLQKQAIAKTNRILNKNWQAVTRMSKALIKHKTLSAGDVSLLVPEVHFLKF